MLRNCPCLSLLSDYGILLLQTIRLKAAFPRILKIHPHSIPWPSFWPSEFVPPWSQEYGTSRNLPLGNRFQGLRRGFRLLHLRNGPQESAYFRDSDIFHNGSLQRK